MNCYLKVPTNNKAKQDIDHFCEEMGFQNLSVTPPLGGDGGGLNRFFAKLLTVARLPFKLKKGDVLLIQYPFKKYYSLLCRIARMKGAKTVTLIHDLGTFRRHKLTAKQEIRRLSHTDYIISHNQAMTDWLRDHGCRVPIGNLEIFDYHSDGLIQVEPLITEDYKEIVYAGGLGRRKNAYLYQMDNIIGTLNLTIYGKGLDEDATRHWINVFYKGFMPSDEFISDVVGHWGLVWDGDSVDGCTGNWGEYLRINNPHKTSFYLRAGLPVILWKEAAMAPLIEKENLGITVGSLRELPERMRSLTQEDYAQMKRNAVAFSHKLQAGYHFKKALNKSLSQL